MLGLKLREEFTGKRAGGTIIDFNNRRGPVPWIVPPRTF
jgi:hypothetical protein